MSLLQNLHCRNAGIDDFLYLNDFKSVGQLFSEHIFRTIIEL